MKIIAKLTDDVGKYGWPIALAAFAVFAVGLTWASSDPLYDNTELFDRITTIISNTYINEIDDSKMIKAGIDGVLVKLDPYSRYLVGSDYDDLMQETEGELEGIGIGLEYHHDSLVVITVLEGTPGQKCDLRPSDRIVSIDGIIVIGKTLKEIRPLLRGQVGSKVALYVFRPQQGDLQIQTYREKVKIRSIPYYGMAPNKIGYIRLLRFSEGSSDEIRNALHSLKNQNIKSLILDLRGNPGGLVSEAVEIAGYFLPANSVIVETRGRNNTLIRRHISHGNQILEQTDLAVLVDNETASAAEIVAGAIQDHDRGVVIGSETFGKGLVQQVMQFSDNTALKLTTSRYFLPSGRCLQRPDWSKDELLMNPHLSFDDSLYITDSGRPVFSEGGIIPDIYLERDIPSPYIDALKQKSIIFDFSSAYVKSHDIKNDFKINDAIMQAFRQFLKSKGFAFQSEARSAFQDLRPQLNADDPAISTALNAISKNLDAQDDYLFDVNYNKIMWEIQENILLLSGREKDLYSQLWIPNQPEIREAISILSDSEKYGSILSYR